MEVQLNNSGQGFSPIALSSSASSGATFSDSLLSLYNSIQRTALDMIDEDKKDVVIGNKLFERNEDNQYAILLSGNFYIEQTSNAIQTILKNLTSIYDFEKSLLNMI
jgi:hypothetical protein